ncbi:MAG: hypothetical protein M3Y17_06170, partial [Actinomycetota bacterium]|nr:hypothetical protein [Actinomycetota bacterium]
MSRYISSVGRLPDDDHSPPDRRAGVATARRGLEGRPVAEAVYIAALSGFFNRAADASLKPGGWLLVEDFD